jgi:hypothetical protein
LSEPGDDHRQSEWVTRMARQAAREFDADWVINADADEFWRAIYPTLTLATALDTVPTAASSVLALRKDLRGRGGRSSGLFSTTAVA